MVEQNLSKRLPGSSPAGAGACRGHGEGNKCICIRFTRRWRQAWLFRAPSGGHVSAFPLAPHPPCFSVPETLKQEEGTLCCWPSLLGPLFRVNTHNPDTSLSSPCSSPTPELTARILTTSRGGAATAPVLQRSKLSPRGRCHSQAATWRVGWGLALCMDQGTEVSRGPHGQR